MSTQRYSVCEELRPQNFLKNERDGFRSPGRSSQTIACICDLLGEARKPSRAFAISWEKLANHRVHLRSPGRSSQTIARICDLLGEDRKPSRTFSICWEKVANRRTHFPSPGRRSQTVTPQAIETLLTWVKSGEIPI